MFSQRFKEGWLDNWEPSFIHDEPEISASTRYFQHFSDTLPHDIMPLDDKVDTHHMLAATSEDGFVHIRDNHVEYYECVKDDKGTYRYGFNILHNSLLNAETHVDANPALFHIGDIVEAQISFVVFPGKNGQRNMRLILRSIALLNGHFTQVRN